MEMLLYAAGERQLKHAIPKIGIQSGRTNLVLIIMKTKSDTDDIEKDIKKLLVSMYHFQDEPTILDPKFEMLQHFGITQKEIDTLPPEHYHHLVLERVAMVDIIK